MIHDTSRIAQLQSLARLIRFHSLRATTTAASGHPTSALSASDLMTGLLFGGTFRFDIENPNHPNNDRLIFSKGHASPLLYALWAAAGKVSEAELGSYPPFGSPRDEPPTRCFPTAEAAMGPLGQGLGIGFGMALHAKYLDQLPYRTYVLLGDSEMAEGSQWETIRLAAHYRLSNLIGIIDVNAPGPSSSNLADHDVGAYARRLEAFGWKTRIIDGHAMPEILEAFESAAAMDGGQPFMILARTLKGKGVSFLEDAGAWHGRALEPEQLDEALRELGVVDRDARGRIVGPDDPRTRVEAAGIAAAVPHEFVPPVGSRKAPGAAAPRRLPAGEVHLCPTDEAAVTIFATDATVQEAFDVHEQLRSAGIAARVIDVCRLKPLDEGTPREPARAAEALVSEPDRGPAVEAGRVVPTSPAEHLPTAAALAVKKRPRNSRAREMRDDVGILTVVETKATDRVARTRKRRRETLAQR